MEKPTTPTDYQTLIQEAIEKIDNTWRLHQIYKFIINITKED